MAQLSDLQTLCDSITATLVQYASDLATEALKPKPSYKIDGKDVSFNEWRVSITKTMSDLQANLIQTKKIINQLQPYVIYTKQVM